MTAPARTHPREDATGSYVLERRTIVPRPLEEVWEFFAEPRNLARITPRWLHFRMREPDTAEMRPGALLEYTIRPLGFPQRWTSEITAYDPPHRFVDEQRRGPYRRWRHEHGFRAVPAGTEVVDRVEYSLPFGPLGRLAHRLLVRPQLQAIFDHRERVIRKQFG